MRKLTAVSYYAASAVTLITQSSFWKIPLVLVKKPILFQVRNGLRFFVWNFMDIWAIKEVVLDHIYEKQIEVDNTTIIDIGAGIGDFSIQASRKAKSVYAYESDRNRVSLLKKNIKLNGCANIFINPKKVTSLDAIFAETNITRCDMLKIDCEGCEYAILLSSKKSLRKTKYIAMEIHLFNQQMQTSYKKLLTLLESDGFTISILPNPVHQSLLYLYAWST